MTQLSDHSLPDKDPFRGIFSEAELREFLETPERDRTVDRTLEFAEEFLGPLEDGQSSNSWSFGGRSITWHRRQLHGASGHDEVMATQDQVVISGKTRRGHSPRSINVSRTSRGEYEVIANGPVVELVSGNKQWGTLAHRLGDGDSRMVAEVGLSGPVNLPRAKIESGIAEMLDSLMSEFHAAKLEQTRLTQQDERLRARGIDPRSFRGFVMRVTGRV